MCEVWVNNIKEACIAAGVPYSNKQRPKSDEEIIDYAKDLYNEYGCVTFKLIRLRYSDCTIFSKFGSLKGLCEAADIPFSSDESSLMQIVKKQLLALGYENFATEVRFPWLKYKQTMFLDIYFPELKLGIEVDGRQHSEFVPHFHSTLEGFEIQRNRDNMKNILCKEHGVRLVRLNEDEIFDFEVIEKKITDALKEEVSVDPGRYYVHGDIYWLFFLGEGMIGKIW